MLSDDVPPKKKLDDIMHLAELCIEVLQQNEEHHAEVFTFALLNVGAADTLTVGNVYLFYRLKLT